MTGITQEVIILLRIIYHKRPNGEEPAKEWLGALERQNPSVHKNILAKIDKFQLEGFKLIATDMLGSIRGYPNMYEIRGGRCRIIGYNDEIRDVFVLLCGLMKTKQREQGQIAFACRLANEYLSNVEGGG